jgi:adenylate cyclase class IV
MQQELKIRIKNYKLIEQKLFKLGAKFLKEIKATDTYFNQPKSLVLKITQDDEGNFLVKLKREDDKFKIIGSKQIGSGVNNLIQKCKSEFGIKCILKKKRRFFQLDNNLININIFPDLGEFLIIQAEKPDKNILQKLGIKNPEFITVPFSELR